MKLNTFFATMKLFVKLIVISVILSLFVSRCASIAPPKGGPKDSLPPLVVRTTPVPYTTNFNSKKITIEFDEYIQLKDQSKIFFMSPPGSKKPKLQIKGKSLEVTFDQKLDSNTTYRLDFGSCIVDNNEGNPLHGYSYVFSTGNVIDSLVMAGQTLGAFERDSVFGSYIFYYDAKADSIKKDSTVFNGKVDALFRTDSSGYFIADILKDKLYRIYALDDTNGDQKYQAGVDRIAFLDTVYNPTELPPFSMIYDSVRRYMVIDPLQVNFELFKEIPVKRQSIAKQERPQRQKIVLTFGSAHPRIDSLYLKDIDPSWIIREPGSVGDSLTLWIAPPTKELVAQLVDTIHGSLLLERQDSVWRPYNSKERLILTHKIVLTQEQLREQAKEQRAKQQEVRQMERAKKTKHKRGKQQIADTLAQVNDTLVQKVATDTITKVNKEDNKKDTTKKVNPFKFTTDAASPLNPTKHISFIFEAPLRALDSAKIELYHITTAASKNQRGNTREKQDEKSIDKTKANEVAIPFTIVNSPTDMRRWTLRANWKPDQEYRLMIPAGAFEDIMFQSNDTLNSKFKIADPDKFGSFKFKTVADTSDKSNYILEIVQKSGKEFNVIERVTGVKPGQEVEVKYLKAGTYNLRIIQDRNHNNKWDTGSLVERRQPEKVRMLIDPDKTRRNLISKERWTVEELLDFKKIFK